MAAPSLRSRLGGAGARTLGRGAGAVVGQALAADPVATCMVAARFEVSGMDRERLGGAFWGVDGGRAALAFSGANIVMLRGQGGALASLADAFGRHGRHCASITGRSDQVVGLWERLREQWGPERELRADQPLMVCAGEPALPSDERVRQVHPGRLEDYFPAAVAMFSEEVGTDPTADDGGAGYRDRIAGLLASGRAFARFEGSTVVYKAEIGALSSTVALIQGVWVHPAWRGRGIAAPATAAVVRAIHRLGRLPSLYVNAHNLPARATYERIGFRQVGTFASVLF